MRSNATDMPMIGPRNAITLQSSKTNALAGRENFSSKPCGKGFFAFYRACSRLRVRTISAHVRVGVVRITLKTCIDAINAINLLCEGRWMTETSHHWIRKLEESRKPAYLTIPDLIEEDLASGRLRPRDRLPGLRDLAEALNLNYTTVARAYAEARKRGLLDARAGSGTFVRGRTQTLPLAGGSGIEMSMNMPPEPPALAARLRESAARLMREADPYQLLRYQDFGGTAADRAAGRTWLQSRVPACAAGRNDLSRYAGLSGHQGDCIAIGREVAGIAAR
jgi:hypothetical protein